MKYIIELKDEPIKGMLSDEGNYYRCKQIPYWSISDSMKNKLTPYTEPDYRKSIEDEVWDFASYAYNNLSEKEFDECYDGWPPQTYKEAKTKYEAWKKEKDKIHFGDEIISVDDDVKAVMLDCADYESIYVMTENGCVERWKDLDGVKKTGRTFPEATELLKKMRGNND